MYYHATDEDTGLHWEDALDEGLLTLEAEWFLISLPKPLIPQLTCLGCPQVLNQVVAQWLAQSQGFQQDLVCISGHSVQQAVYDPNHEFTLPANLRLSALGPYQLAVTEELNNLCKWMNLVRSLATAHTSSLAA